MLYTEKMSRDNSEIAKFLMTGRTWYFSFIRNIYSWIHVQGMKWVCFVHKLTEHKQYFLYLSKKNVICPLKPCIHRRGMRFDNVLGTVRYIAVFWGVRPHKRNSRETSVLQKIFTSMWSVCLFVLWPVRIWGGGVIWKLVVSFLSSS